MTNITITLKAMQDSMPRSLSRNDTANFTLGDIQKEVNEICAWFDKIWPGDKSMVAKHIPVSWTQKVKNAVGTTHRQRINGIYRYSISFGQNFMKTTTVQGFHSTILHECLHCIETNDQDGWSHTGLWKERAAIISRVTPYQIHRIVDPHEITPEYQKIMQASYKYKISCECGWACYRQRITKSLKEIARGSTQYSCPICRSNKLTVRSLM